MKYSQVKNWDKKDICVKYKSTKQTNVHFGGPGREQLSLGLFLGGVCGVETD